MSQNCTPLCCLFCYLSSSFFLKSWLEGFLPVYFRGKLVVKLFWEPNGGQDIAFLVHVAMLQCYNGAMLQCCKVVKLQWCKVAMVQWCKVTKLQSFNVAKLQCYNVALLQCCNVTNWDILKFLRFFYASPFYYTLPAAWFVKVYRSHNLCGNCCSQKGCGNTHGISHSYKVCGNAG